MPTDLTVTKHGDDVQDDDARYFIGLMVWDAGELESQVEGRQWEIKLADADVVRRQTGGLWNALRGSWVRLDTGFVTRLDHRYKR